MARILTINSIQIPEIDIVSVTYSDETIEFADSSLISSKIDITLINTNYDYDERVYGTMFYRTNYINWEVTLYDDELQLTTWQGRLKSYELDDRSRTIKITSNDYVRDIVDTSCQAVYSNITISDAIYYILTDVRGLNIPQSKIVIGTFDDAKSIQGENTISINYTVADNVKCIDVLRTLCKYSSCYLYMVNNLILLYQDRPYEAKISTPITDRDIIPGTYKQWGDDSNIYNAYNIAYMSGVYVTRAIGSDAQSQSDYGKISTFILPESGNDSTLASDYPIIFETQAGATAAGELILSLYKRRQVMCSFDLDWHMQFLQLNDTVDLKFTPFVCEPVKITKIKRNEKSRRVSVGGILQNYYRTIDVDDVKPDPIDLIHVFGDDGCVYITWQKSLEENLYGYKLYYTSSLSNWYNEVAGDYMSPISLLASNLTLYNSDILYKLDGLQNGVEYYFKVRVIDKNLNESVDSSILSATPKRQYLITENAEIIEVEPDEYLEVEE